MLFKNWALQIGKEQFYFNNGDVIIESFSAGVLN